MKIKFYVKKLSTLLLLLLIVLGSIAHNKSITGIVKGDDGMVLPGVTVLIKGTTQGTVTDGNGSFSITGVQGNAVLVFSFIGICIPVLSNWQ